MTRFLVTGAAGFIGFHTTRYLLARGDDVVGIDNLNAYYDVALKEARLRQLESYPRFSFRKLDVADRPAVATLFEQGRFTHVLHLAAQAGVRHSLVNPFAYIDSNLNGFANILEGCRHARVKHLVFASSSSVYGSNTRVPFSVHHNVDHPISLYAATKKANELMAHSYSHLFGLPTTGLRFFTVYGPWGRPDMAMFIFARAIARGEPIWLFNEGRMERDFTFVDDVVEATIRVLDRIPEGSTAGTGEAPDPATSSAPYRIYNVGNHAPVQVMKLVALLERAIGREADVRLAPIQPGDVPATFADVADLARDIDFCPSTPIEVGVNQFVQWFLEFYADEVGRSAEVPDSLHARH